MPVARTGVPVVGIDRSDPMLEYARRRVKRLRVADRPALVRGDIRRLPFGSGTFSAVMAPYGILQSLTNEDDLAATLSEAARVLRRGGTLGIDLVPDLPAWDEYRNQARLMGRLGPIGRARHPDRVGAPGPAPQADDLRPGVRREARRRTERHRFSLTFRTLPLPQMVSQVEKAGFLVTAVLGDYRGRAWDLRADVWLLLASRR